MPFLARIRQHVPALSQIEKQKQGSACRDDSISALIHVSCLTFNWFAQTLVQRLSSDNVKDNRAEYPATIQNRCTGSGSSVCYVELGVLRMGSLFDDMMERHSLEMQGSARCEACGSVFFGVDGCPDCRFGNEDEPEYEAFDANQLQDDHDYNR